jgi:hypothetical protein
MLPTAGFAGGFALRLQRAPRICYNHRLFDRSQ